MFIIIVIVIILLLVALVFPDRVSELINGLKSNIRQEKNLMTRSEMDAELRTLRNEVTKMYDDNTTLRQTINKLLYKNQENTTDYINRLERLNNELLNLNKKLDQFTSTIEHKIEVLSRTTPQQSQPESKPHPTYPIKRYAKYPEQNSKGFRIDQLSEFEEDSIFEITINSAYEAVFHLISDNSIRRQLFPMLNNVVKPVCDIIIESHTPDNIEDVSYGTLKKEEDHWIITSKATIKLV